MRCGPLVRILSRTEGALGAAVPSAMVLTLEACGAAGMIRRDSRGLAERIGK